MNLQMVHLLQNEQAPPFVLVLTLAGWSVQMERQIVCEVVIGIGAMRRNDAIDRKEEFLYLFTNVTLLTRLADDYRRHCVFHNLEDEQICILGCRQWSIPDVTQGDWW